MTATNTARCHDCSAVFAFDPAAHTHDSPRGPVVVPPRRCPTCESVYETENARLFESACADKSLAHTYRCRGCRRLFLLLRPWTRAGGLLFCPECRPGYFQRNPLDARLNAHHHYPKY